MQHTSSSRSFIVLSYLFYAIVFLLLPSLTVGSIILNEQIQGVQRDGEQVDNNKNDPSLLELYNNLTSIFDFESIQHFVQRKNETDPEARALLMSINNYLRGPKAKRLVNVLWNDEEFIDLIAYVHKHGLTDIYEQINKIHEIFGYDPVHSPSQNFLEKEIIYESSIEKPKIIEITLLLDKPQEKLTKVQTNTNNNNGHTSSNHKLKIRDQLLNRNIIREEPATAPRLIQEFMDFLPLEQVRKFMSYASTIPSFLSLHAKASQPRFAQHYRDFKKQPEIAELETIIKEAGLEFDSLRKIIEMLMKWENHTSVGLFDTQ